MQNHNHLTRLIQANRAAENFNHNLVVNWAIALLESGKETTNLLMLASFGPPIDAFEIRPYIIAVLKDMGLEELKGDEAAIAIIGYYITEIVLDNSIRSNLEILSELYYKFDFNFGLDTFYFLHFAWQDLEAREHNYYYEGATLDNIESLLKKEAQTWLTNH